MTPGEPVTPGEAVTPGVVTPGVWVTPDKRAISLGEPAITPGR